MVMMLALFWRRGGGEEAGRGAGGEGRGGDGGPGRGGGKGGGGEGGGRNEHIRWSVIIFSSFVHHFSSFFHHLFIIFHHFFIIFSSFRLGRFIFQSFRSSFVLVRFVFPSFRSSFVLECFVCLNNWATCPLTGASSFFTFCRHYGRASHPFYSAVRSVSRKCWAPGLFSPTHKTFGPRVRVGLVKKMCRSDTSRVRGVNTTANPSRLKHCAVFKLGPSGPKP